MNGFGMFHSCTYILAFLFSKVRLGFWRDVASRKTCYNR